MIGNLTYQLSRENKPEKRAFPFGFLLYVRCCAPGMVNFSKYFSSGRCRLENMHIRTGEKICCYLNGHACKIAVV